MILRVYRYTDWEARSIRRAEVIDEVEVDEFPENQCDFVAEHDGDFIEVIEGVDGDADSSH